MLSTPAAFPFFRELIAFLTSPLLMGLVLISSISGTSSAVITIGFVGGGLLREVEVNSTWLITSELANQRARKVLFTCVVYTKSK